MLERAFQAGHPLVYLRQRGEGVDDAAVEAHGKVHNALDLVAKLRLLVACAPFPVGDIGEEESQKRDPAVKFRHTSHRPPINHEFLRFGARVWYGSLCYTRRHVVGEGSALSMIRHDVILRIKPGVNREVIDRTLRDVRDLLVEIPGVERVRYGVNNSPAYRHALIAVELPDEETLHRFGRHPLHARAVRFLNRLADSTAVGSYVVPSQRRRG